MPSETEKKLIECIEVIHHKIISMDKKINKLYEVLYINKMFKSKEIQDYEEEIGKIEP